MVKDEWLNYRERVVHGDLEATMKAFGFFCLVNSIQPSAREVQAVQQLISLKALIRWVDVQLGVCIITDKDKYVVRVF